MEKILRVDVGASGGPSAKEEPVGRYEKLGGRAMTSTVVWEEVPPTCDPLGAQNKLVFSPGMLAGSAATTSGRISVGCKSPLTGGIKEANSGGQAGQVLARLGYAALILEGERKTDDLYKIYIENDQVIISECNSLKMMGNYDIVEKLRQDHGDSAVVVSIGQAGELCLKNSTISVTDPEGRPTRHAARGGVGAVMGSKGIKAIVINSSGTSVRQPLDKDGFKRANKKLAQTLMDSEVTGKALPAFGTAMLMDVTNEGGCFPAYNCTKGRFDRAQEISGGTLAALEEERGGKGSATHGCHRGCVIKCSGIFTDQGGNYISKQPEYETLWSHGGNCGISDLDAIALMDRKNDDIGLDTIETGCTMGVMMEAGEIEFGDSEAVLALMDEIASGTEKGRLIGSGTATVAKHFGVERAPVVKGQAMAAYDPRALKGIGVTYATSPMGADHTAGHTMANHYSGVEPVSDALDKENQLMPSAIAQISSAAIDATGFCLFVGLAAMDKPQAVKYMLEILTAFTGLGFSESSFAALGIRILHMEIDFNRQAGFTPEDDRLPEWMTKEPLEPHNTVFDVPDEILDQVHNHVAIIIKMAGNTKVAMSPTISLMGEGCHKTVPDNLAAVGVTKPLIVTDKGVVNVGLAKILTDALEEKFMDYALFDGTEPNPTIKNVEAALELYKQEECNGLISLGGGSPHDCAKAVGVMANNPGSTMDYSGMMTVWNSIPVLMAVNTTSGTGSDASFAAVISDPEKHRKAPIADPKLIPIFAVNDPLLTRSMPPHITAGTGMDALTHAIEAYCSVMANPYSDGQALQAIRLIGENLARAVENGDDLRARENMCTAQFCAGLAMNSAQLGNAHSLSHALSAEYNLPHGDCNSIVLPYVMRRNKSARAEQMAEIAQAMGADISGLSTEEAADKAIEMVEALQDRIGISKTITELAERCRCQVNEDDIDELVAHAALDFCCAANPVAYSTEDFSSIYRKAWK